MSEKRGSREVDGAGNPATGGGSPMYIGVGTVLLIVLIVLLIAFVF
jgi:hypothetical protein